MSDRILIVDDSLTVRMDLAEAFDAAGFSAVPCATAEAARAACAAGAFAAIVLDVVLPDADGIALLAELKASPATAETPVFILSSEAEVRERIRGLRQGAAEFLGKPYDPLQVVARVEARVRRRGPPGSEPPMVLVVDDSATFRAEIAATLAGAGYAVAQAATGEEGLRRAAALRPAAIVVDGVLPGLDGPAVIRRIRLDPGLHRTPCLLLTASEGATDEVSALDAGADAYVRKGDGPLVILARLAALLRAAAESRAGDPGPGASLLAPKRVLAVDDSPTYLGEISEILAGEGYDVVTARSGEEALELLAVAPVDAIVLDVVMPGLGGTDTCRRIKASPATRGIPLLMLTARDDSAAMLAGIEAGADDYIAKSADADVLRARVRAQLRRKQFEDENRRVREALLRKDGEARAARERAAATGALLAELEAKNATLGRQATELAALNHELETFAYSVSHDLRTPLRAIDGFSLALVEDLGPALPPKAREHLDRVRAAVQRMARLIDDLLALARVARVELHRAPVDLSALAAELVAELRAGDPGRTVEVRIAPALTVEADPMLTRILLENLVGNAWKFTARRTSARIELAADVREGRPVHVVRDNGAGFDMRFAGKLFGAFQRLHAAHEFPGTGIGLATVQRIVHRHGGRVWAEGAVGEGAAFGFTLTA